MQWLFLIIPFIVIIYLAIDGYRRNRRLKQLEKLRREQEAEIQEILGGFDVATERGKIIKLLSDALPNVYKCGRWNCGGILLKRTTDSKFNYYYCIQCGNFRSIIRKVKLDKWS